MQKLGKIRPYRLEGPVTFETEYTSRNALPIELAPGAEMIDARTVRFRGKDFLEAWKLSRGR